MKKQVYQSTKVMAIIIAFVLNVSCSKDEPVIGNGNGTVKSKDLAFQVKLDDSFEKTIYPSVILGLSNYISNTQENGSFQILKYQLKSPYDNAELKVSMASTEINSESVFNKTLGKKGEEHSFYPKINWNYNKLKELKTGGSISASFKSFIDNKEVDNKNITLQYRAVNECVWGFLDENNKFVDLKWMFGGYVNEDHPKIDELLKKILEHKLVNSFHGYQGSVSDVYFQVLSIWHHLQTKNVKYSSITDTSNGSKKVFSQNVRFFEEVYNNKQANCVDGTVFMSSVLKKIGIKPFLVLVPGHMYLGFYTKPDKTEYAVLETTMLGNVDINEVKVINGKVYNLEKYKKYITQEVYNSFMNGKLSLEVLRQQISYGSFIQALNANKAKFTSNINKFKDPNNNQYTLVDIEEIRKVIKPIK